MVKAILTGVFTQTEGTDHTNPHSALWIHILSCLSCGQWDGIQPQCHTQTRLAVVLQHQFLLHILCRISTSVEWPPHVEVQLTGMGNKSLRLNNLHIAGLLIPEVTEHVSRSLQKL